MRERAWRAFWRRESQGGNCEVGLSSVFSGGGMRATKGGARHFRLGLQKKYEGATALSRNQFSTRN